MKFILAVVAVLICSMAVHSAFTDNIRQAAPDLAGIFKGYFHELARENKTAESHESYFTVIDNLVVLQSSKMYFAGLIQLDPQTMPKQMLVHGESSRQNETSSNSEDRVVEPVKAKCIYDIKKKMGGTHFQFACGNRTHWPVSFEDKHLEVNTTFFRPSNSSVPQKMQGMWVGQVDMQDRHEYSLAYFDSNYLLVSTLSQKKGKSDKDDDKYEFSSFNAIAKFNWTMPHQMMLKDRVRMGKQDPDQYFFYNVTNVAHGKKLKLRWFRNGTMVPKNDMQGDSGYTGYQTSDPTIGSTNMWYGRNEEPNTGALDVAWKVYNKKNMINARTANWQTTGGYYVDYSSSPNKWIFLGVSANRNKDGGQWQNIRFERSVMKFDADRQNKNWWKICSSRGDKEDFKCSDPNVQQFQFIKTEKQKQSGVISGIQPQQGREGSTIYIGYKENNKKRSAAAAGQQQFFSVLAQRLGMKKAFGSCSKTITIDIGGAPCSNVQCDTAKHLLKCTLGTPVNTGPNPLNVYVDGLRVPTSVQFMIKPSSTSVKIPQVGQIYPFKLKLDGGKIFMSLTNVDNLQSSTVEITVGGDACQNLVKVGSHFVYCTAPKLSAGVQDIVVKVGSVYSTSPRSIIYESNDGKLRIGGVSPKEGSVDGGQKIYMKIFVKGADGSVPSDLTVKVSIGGQSATNVVGPTPAPQQDNTPELYTVTCDTPASATTGPVELLFQASSNGENYIGKSKFTYMNANQDENIIIKSISPKKGSSDGSQEITIVAKVPSSISEDASEGEITIGGNECSVTGTPTLSSGVATVKCTTSPTAAGTYPVILSYPGGKSISKTLYTFTSNTQPSISGIQPNSIASDKAQNYTITGNNLAPQTKKRAVDCSNVQVSLGEQSCDNVQCSSSSSVSAECPPSVSSGDTAIVVTSNGESSPSDSSLEESGVISVSSNSQPAVTGLSPATGSTNGGDEVTVSGTNFGTDESAITLTIGGNLCSVVSNSLAGGNTFKCTSPAGAVGSNEVLVEVAGEASPAYASSWTYTQASDPSSGAAGVRAGLLSAAGVIVAAAFMM